VTLVLICSGSIAVGLLIGIGITKVVDHGA